MTLGELFQNSYSEISLAAKRITRRRDISLAASLINDTYLDLQIKNANYPKDPRDFVKYFNRSMKIQFIGKRTAFGKNNPIVYSEIEIPETPDIEALNEIELDVETISPATKELIEVSSTMKKERALKYIQVLEFKRTLPLHEQCLFDLYFDKQLSSRSIADQLSKETGFDMNYQRINSMINEIKTKIKNHKWQ